MAKLLVVCLGVILTWPASESFSLADRVGEPNARSFFLFSTSAGNYTIRQDGMGEFTSPKGMRRVFKVTVGPNGRLERVYFLEHEGDLLLLYEVRGQNFYLVRMEQQKRKMRWLTALGNVTEHDASVDGDVVRIGTIEVRKVDGTIVR
jgi:hypothetical protein